MKNQSCQNLTRNVLSRKEGWTIAVTKKSSKTFKYEQISLRDKNGTSVQAYVVTENEEKTEKVRSWH